MLESFKALCRDMKLKFTVEKVVEFTVLNVRFECNDIVISVYSHYPLDPNAKSSDTKCVYLQCSYGSLGVPQIPRSCNTLIEVFKIIWDVETPISITITSRLRFVILFVEFSRVCGAARLASYSKKVTLLQIKFKSVYLLSKPLLKIGSLKKAGCFDIESSSLLA